MTPTDPRNRPTLVEGLRRRVIRELRDHETLAKAPATAFLRAVDTRASAALEDDTSWAAVIQDSAP